MLGLIATHVLKPGVGFNIDPATLDGKAVASYAAKAHGQTTVDFLMHIIPDTLVVGVRAGRNPADPADRAAVRRGAGHGR